MGNYSFNMKVALYRTNEALENTPRGNAVEAINLAEARMPRRILLASDTYPGQLNGVELSLEETRRGLEELGHEVAYIKTHPTDSYQLPKTPEVRVSLPGKSEIRRFIDSFTPHFIHVATEGPVGFQVRAVCRDQKFEFTSSFHTMWPDYAQQHFKIPPFVSWPLLRWFHAPAARTMTRSESMVDLLASKGFKNLEKWYGGVDISRFSPGSSNSDMLIDHKGDRIKELEYPVLLYIGRVSAEKNLDAFLDIPLERGSKVVVGDGQALPSYIRRYPEVHFIGRRAPEELPDFYRLADAFVFPSKTDTFGRVIIEALACGTPVAAFPVTGPKDIVTSADLGVLNDDLQLAIQEALLKGKTESCVNHAKKYSLDSVLRQFMSYLEPVKKNHHQQVQEEERYVFNGLPQT
jgi:glycosyltransferase involved in cell wall biosynthesis